MSDPGDRAVQSGERTVSAPADRVLADRVTAYGADRDNPASFTDDDGDGGGSSGGGGGQVTLIDLKPTALDAKLQAAGQGHPLQAALDKLAANKTFANASFALVDLSDTGKRVYAGVRDDRQRFIASTAKLAILYAAFQVRATAIQNAPLVTGKTDKEVFAAISKAWKPTISRWFMKGDKVANSLPILPRILLAQNPGAGWNIKFNDSNNAGGPGGTFLDRLNATVLQSDDAAAASCVRDLGFPLINGLLAAAGFHKSGRGLWLSLDYGGVHWDPQAGKDGSYSAQASTARVLAAYLTLLNFDELVPGTRDFMFGLMAGVDAGQRRPQSASGFIDEAIVRQITEAERASFTSHSKVGFLDTGPFGDAGIYARSSKNGPIKYVAVVLNADTPDDARRIGAALDAAVAAARPAPSPPQP